jgi:hypothetical protein
MQRGPFARQHKILNNNFKSVHAKSSQAPSSGANRKWITRLRRRSRAAGRRVQTRRAATPSAHAATPSRRGPQHHRFERSEHPEAHADRQGHDGRRRDRDAQAGADFSDPESADRAERLHLLGRRARSAAGRLRIPSRARLQLPAGAGRHLCVAVANSQVRSADGRYRVGANPASEGRRAVLRPHQGGGGQLRSARSGARSCSSKT